MFAKALAEAVRRLRKLSQTGELSAFALIGGLAVSRWSEPRATGDLDFAIKLGSLSLEDLAARLKGKHRVGDIRDPLEGSVTFYVSKEASVPVQLVQFPPAWEEIALHDLKEHSLDALSIPIADWKAIVLLKLYAGGALDLEDARKILYVMGTEEADLSYIRKKAAALRVSKRLAKIQLLR